MNTKAFARFAILSLAITMVVLEVAPKEAEAVTCNPIQLSPCAGAISSSSPPSSQCCQRLKDQTPCLCQYYRDPNLSQYVNSPGARRVASACRVSVQC